MTAHSSSRRYLNYSQIISLCITPRPSCTIFCLPIRIVNSPTTNEIHEQTCCSHSLIGTYTRIMCHTKDNFDRVSCMYIQSSFPAQKKRPYRPRTYTRSVNEGESVCNEDAIRYVLYATLHFLWAQN